MPANLEVKYFNSFVLRKTAKNTSEFFKYEPYPLSVDPQSGTYPTIRTDQYKGIFYGLPFKTTPDFPTYPGTGTSPGFNPALGTPTWWEPDASWYIEEARIEGGFNNSSVSLGVRAYADVDDDQNKLLNRQSSLIYSGVYNSKNGVNETNVFSIGESITRTLDPGEGSVQYLHAEDNNLVICQENKLNRALIDKDAIYTAEGTGITTTGNVVIGQLTPYAGRYGISKNPESFSYFGFRKYMADRNRNSILRLSMDGVTEISQYGMSDFFRDKLRELDDDQFKFTIKAGYQDGTGGAAWSGLPTSEIWWSNSTGGSSSFVVIADWAADDYRIPYIDYGACIRFGGSELGYSTIVFYDPVGAGTRPPGSTFFLQSSIVVPGPGNIYIDMWKKDQIIGGYDENNDFYTITLKKAPRSLNDGETIVSTFEGTNTDYFTITFDETVKGWTSFFNYKPEQMFSWKGNFYSTKGDTIYRHYSDSINRGNFYGVDNPASIEFIFNSNPSVVKNFKTIGYEGSSGWEVETFKSGVTGPVTADGSSGFGNYQDVIATVKSYYEGYYVEGGITYRAGFNLKENKYVANIINNSPAMPGEVVFGDSMSGIKGYFATVKVKTDSTTDPGGMKELFAVDSEFVVSSN